MKFSRKYFNQFIIKIKKVGGQTNRLMIIIYYNHLITSETYFKIFLLLNFQSKIVNYLRKILIEYSDCFKFTINFTKFGRIK